MRKILISVLVLGSISGYAQKYVSGIVSSETDGNPLQGAKIVLKGSESTAITDKDGKFRIYVPSENTVLVFTFAGMKPMEVLVGNKNQVNIALENHYGNIEELVITGYQNLDRSKFTGASQRINANEMKIDGFPDASRMLEGRASGVNVQNVTGTFGTAPKITIRGGSSIFGDTKPLWVVDGAIQEEVVNLTFEQLASGDASTLISSAIAGLNPNDIETIEILKDASALSLYGARALNGAIIIKTKSGKRNSKLKVSYQLEQSVRQVPNYNQYDILNSQETMSIYRDLEDRGYFSLSSHTQGRYGGVYNILYRAINTYDPKTGSFLVQNTKEGREAFLKKYEYANTDWFKTLFQSSFTQNHTVSMSGGGENSSQYASLGFYTDPGWSIADRVRRLTGNFKGSYDVSKNIKLGVLAQGTYRDQKAPGTYNRAINTVDGEYTRIFDINPFSYALNTSRALRPYDDSGNYEYYRYNYAPMNILNELRNNYMDINVLELKLQGDLDINLTKNLKYSFLGSVRYVKSTNEHSITEDSNVAAAHRANETTVVAENNPFLFHDPNDPDTLPVVVLPSGGILKTTQNTLNSYYFRNALEFKKKAQEHYISAFLGQEYRQTDRDTNTYTGFGYQFKRGGTPFTDYRILQKYISQNEDYFSKTFLKDRGIAFFLQGSYGYDNRYVLSATVNYEGSNRLGKNASARWLPTWNVSGKWNVSNEAFLRGNNNISNLSVRASYGLIAGLGNATNSLPIFRNSITKRYDVSTRENVILLSQLENSQLTWEKSYETNLGLDLGLFGNKINLSLDIYKKDAKDLIDYVRTSGIGGQQYKFANNASMTTKGIEVALTTHNITKPNFSWKTNVNFAFFDQKITSLQSQSNVFDLVHEFGGNVIGEQRNTLYSFDFAGLNSLGLPTFNLASGQATLSGINFQDTQDILKYLKKEGAVEPNITGGFSNTFRYKNWELSALITFQAGNKIRKAPVYSSNYTDLSVFSKSFVNRWINSGDETKTNIPSIPSMRTINSIGPSDVALAYMAYNYSTQNVVDGSFIRMKNISLSYSFSKEVIQRLNLSNLTLRFQATNPFLIYADKGLNGQDPEFFRSGGVAYPVVAQYSLSINLGI